MTGSAERARKDTASAFAELQKRLGAVWAFNTPGAGVEHVLVALPSFSVGESLLSHYTTRIPSLEHRYLLAQLMLHRISGCELVFVTCAPPEPDVLGYYVSLMPSDDARSGAKKRMHVVVVPDRTPRSVAAKLLDRPDLIDGLKRTIGGRPTFIEPWNVTDDEVELALRLDAPINGSAPSLWPLGFKSAGRKLFKEAGVPVATGSEDVRTPKDVVAAIKQIRHQRPDAPGVVIKLDDSGAGDGNVVVDLDASEPSDEDNDQRLAAIPDWFEEELVAGGVVEELIRGDRFTSPSAQVDILPDGQTVVLSTHEQVLGGENGQVYMGCRFPADPAYAAEIARYGYDIGRALAHRGARGRCSIDFAAAQLPSGRWRVVALEINLRKGGTTHPYSVLRNLVPGLYSAAAGRWIAADGSTRCYSATDNLIDERWCGVPPKAVIEAVRDAGLGFDHRRGTGVVLHMLSGLAIDGRFGLTAVGRSTDEAAQLYEATVSTVRRL
jgi:hypothetical protein